MVVTGKAPRYRMRFSLRMVATVDFRHGIPSHYEALKKKRLLADIEDDETILLVSQTGRQLAFVFRELTLIARNGEPVHAVYHLRVQLDRHTPFNQKMLSEYADMAGIELLHIKRFEEHIKAAA